MAIYTKIILGFNRINSTISRSRPRLWGFRSYKWFSLLPIFFINGPDIFVTAVTVDTLRSNRIYFAEFLLKLFFGCIFVIKMMCTLIQK